LVNAMTETQNQKPVEVSVVFPAYNEADHMENAVKKTAQALKEFTSSFEIIIAEDGSTDGTAELSEELAKKHVFLRHIHGEKRLGRGAALNNAFKQSRGKVLVYMDADLATNIKHLKQLVKAVEEGFDFAVGSRMLSESKVERSRRRRAVSTLYNSLIRWMLGSKLKDHQCGFKAFKREALLQVMDEVAARHWFWDTELLVRASRRGYAIAEIPVEWKSPVGTKVNLLKDSLSMGGQAVKLWWRLKLQH
jgi:glycosyltransferase involved in cell wall biosynthesis